MKRVAYHEAGHAVIAFLMGRRLTHISVLSEEDVENSRTGLTHYGSVVLSLRSRRSTVEKAIRVALAGGIAERIVFPDSSSGDEDDVAAARKYAEWYLHPSHGEVDRLRLETRALLQEHWLAVEAVATLLDNEALGNPVAGSRVAGVIRAVISSVRPLRRGKHRTVKSR